MALPALRYVDAFPVEHQGQQYICLRDPEGVVEEQIMLTPPAFFIACQLDGRSDIVDIQYAFAKQFGFTPPFGDVGRGLVYLAPLCRGDTPCYTVSLSHAGTPPPLLPALHVPHRDRCCDAPPEPRNRAMTRLPPRSGPATTPPLPGCGRPVAPAGMGHALACLAGPAESGGSGDRDAPGQTSGASASSDD